MHDQHRPWSPHLGQRVRVKETGQVGMIEDIEGIGVYERFILKLDPVHGGARAHLGRHTAYRLDELER